MMKRVALVDDRYYCVQGAQKNMLFIAEVLKRNGFDPLIVTSAHGELARRAQERDLAVRVVHAPHRALQFGGAGRRGRFHNRLAFAATSCHYSVQLARALRAENVDIIWANALRPMMLLAWTRLRQKAPVVWYVQSAARFPVVSTIAAMFASHIVLVAEGAGTALPSLMARLRKGSISVIYSGVTTTRHKASGQARPRHNGAESAGAEKENAGCIVIASVGALVEAKGHQVLCQAVQQLKSLTLAQPFRVIIAGPSVGGSEAFERRLRESIAEDALPVELLGWVDHIDELLAEAEVFVLASRVEGMPLVVLEAMVQECVPVVTAVGGVNEAVADGHSGFVVAIDDVELLSERLAWLINHPQERHEMAAAARVAILEQFSLDHYEKRLLRLFSELVSRGR